MLHLEHMVTPSVLIYSCSHEGVNFLTGLADLIDLVRLGIPCSLFINYVFINTN